MDAKCEELSRVGETRSTDSGPCALLVLAGVAALVPSHGESDATLLVPVGTVGHEDARGTSFCDLREEFMIEEVTRD
jgi:hypothetical protein